MCSALASTARSPSGRERSPRPTSSPLAALESSRRLGFDHHYFAFPALRTAAQLALERRHLDAAASLVEQILELVSGARPVFEYLAQLDRARIWAAAGNLEEALSSLPAARTALRCDHSVLFAQADELEARLRLALGDPKEPGGWPNSCPMTGAWSSPR